jgi:single-strand DNA-binding protein
MNSVVLAGRLVSDPELRFTQNDNAVSTFTLAVDKFVNGEKDADFIRCKVWGKQAENLAEYQNKGSRICLKGSIETSSYDGQDGNKKYVTEVRCDSIEYMGSKKEDPKSNTNKNDNRNNSNNRGNNRNNRNNNTDK